MMSIKVGDIAPEISGTDLVKNVPWSLKGQATATVFLALAPLSGPAVDDIANGLVAVWNALGKTDLPFSMALVTGFAPVTGPLVPETKESLQAAIKKYKIPFPVVAGPDSWKTYIIPDVKTPAWYCLHWEQASGAYRVNKLTSGVPQGGAEKLKNDLLAMLHDCGVTVGESVWGGGPPEPAPAPFRPLDPTLLPMILWFLGSPPTDGGGTGIRPGGKPIPVPPGDPLWILGAAGRDAIIGLYIAALGAQISDAEMSDKIKRAGISAAKAALGKL
jgi:hypothetical protein